MYPSNNTSDNDLTTRHETITQTSDLEPPSTSIQATFSSATTINEPGTHELRPGRSRWWGSSKEQDITPAPEDEPEDCIEKKYKKGYPLLAAFMDLDPEFSMFRRFNRLHIRTLLYKQDELSELEERLDLEDSQETIQRNLSSRRHDTNAARKILLELIDKKLTEYDKALLRHQKLQSTPPVIPRNSRSFYNYIDGTRPLVQTETLFTKNMEDFVPSCTKLQEHGFLDAAVEWLIPKLFCNRPCLFAPKELRRKTSYDHAHLYKKARIRRLVRFLVTILTIKSLLVPIVLLYYITTTPARLSIVGSFTAAICLMLSGFTDATRYEIFAATAAYAAVLVVFLASIRG